MSLAATVAGAVDLAFAAAGDLVADVWVTRQVTSAYDSATGDTTQTEVEYQFTGIVDTIERRGETGSNSLGAAGSEVEQQKQRVFLKPGDADPQQGDELRVGETRYRIAKVVPVMPDGVTVILWELEVES